ncbi:MAG: hypothetical protein GY719_12445 [bacterium]|nr:hypothetical protein [bacterium]
MSDAIIDKLRDILRDSSAEDRDWDSVDGSTTIESLGIDSLSILDLLYDIDQDFGITLEAAEVIDIGTVGEIAALLRKRGA